MCSKTALPAQNLQLFWLPLTNTKKQACLCVTCQGMLSNAHNVQFLCIVHTYVYCSSRVFLRKETQWVRAACAHWTLFSLSWFMPLIELLCIGVFQLLSAARDNTHLPHRLPRCSVYAWHQSRYHLTALTFWDSSWLSLHFCDIFVKSWTMDMWLTTCD